MKGLDVEQSHTWSLGHLFGYDHPFLQVNTAIVIHTWIIIGLFILVCTVIRLCMKSSKKMTAIVLFLTESSMDFITASLGCFSYRHYCFIVTLFMFIVACNIAPIIPWLEEPTQNLNTTLALGIISFVYIQLAIISIEGFWGYIKNEYFSPFFLMLPLHLIGKIASIISISFRLFGNIFGGSVISQIYFYSIEKRTLLQIFGLFSGTNLVIIGFFTLFEGLLQAFVFTMLTLTYLGIALQGKHERIS